MIINNQPLAITGMHRSGTSLLSQYLYKCGLPIGRELLDGGIVSGTSRGGHHEDKEFVEFHEKILRANRSSIFITKEKKLPLKITPRLRRNAENLIDARENWAQWGWKNPRTTLFLDFWAATNENIRFIFIFREPLQVVNSLIRRGKDEVVLRRPVVALQAWRIYNKQILSFLKRNKERSILFDVEDFIEDPTALISALVNRFHIEVSTVELNSFFSKESFNRSLLPKSAELIETENVLLSECQDIYKKLREEARLIIS